MRERQEFLDRYFVFNADWQPPRDYAHTSGLVEDIRQAISTDRERAQLERDAGPRSIEPHEPTAPLDLPAPPPARTVAPASEKAPATGQRRRRP